jgi:hypothetical protein
VLGAIPPLAVDLQQHQISYYLLSRTGYYAVNYRPQLRHGELDVAVQQLIADLINDALRVGRKPDLKPKRPQPQYGIYRRRLAVVLR